MSYVKDEINTKEHNHYKQKSMLHPFDLFEQQTCQPKVGLLNTALVLLSWDCMRTRLTRMRLKNKGLDTQEDVAPPVKFLSRLVNICTCLHVLSFWANPFTLHCDFAQVIEPALAWKKKNNKCTIKSFM